MTFQSILQRFLCGLSLLLFLNEDLHAQGFAVVKSNEGIEILENGKKVLFYQAAPKSIEGKYERAGYVHPLYDLNGNILTEDGPADHPYHRGIFWAWHQIILNDKNVADGWTSDHINWKPVNISTEIKGSAVAIHAELLWNLALPGEQQMGIIKENTAITIFKSTEHYRILDLNIRLMPLVDDLKIGGSDDEKGYGGFCLRLKLPADLSFTSQNKKVIPSETAVYAGPWMDFSGSFAGTALPEAGVTVFAYPPAVDTSYPWILRSSESRSMQNVSFPGRTPIALPAKGLDLFYRVVVHDDKFREEEIEKLYEDYKPES